MANIFCCFLSMALVFVPKIVFIRKHAHDPREKEEDEKNMLEQEREYKEVVKDNELLQKKLKEVSNERKKKTFFYLFLFLSALAYSAHHIYMCSMHMT